jgi:heat shock protein HslJ
MRFPVKTAAVLAAAALAATIAVRGDSAGSGAYDRAVAAQGGGVILANGSDSASGDLEGAWVITMVENGVLVPEAKATLTFTGGEVQGFAGCNFFFTRVMPAPGGLRFAPVSADPLVCAAPVMEMETAILRAVGTVSGYRIEGDGGLTLESGGVPVMRAVRAP